MRVEAKVLRRFRNKYSKNIHEKGDLIEVSEKRYKEINSTSFGTLIEKTERKLKK